MSVIVLGADGYLGWALLCALARSERGPLVAVDDLSKRRRVAEQGFASALPIPPFEERLAPRHEERAPRQRAHPQRGRYASSVKPTGNARRRARG